MAKTKKEMFSLIATINADNDEIVSFCEHEIELLDARKTSSKKSLTANQKANLEIKDTILAVLAETAEPLTITAMLSNEKLSNFTCQKLSALLKQLVDEHTVVKTMEKKKAFFALA